MDETIYVIFKVQFDFALEMWYSILPKSRWKFYELNAFNVSEKLYVYVSLIMVT